MKVFLNLFLYNRLGYTHIISSAKLIIRIINICTLVKYFFRIRMKIKRKRCIGYWNTRRRVRANREKNQKVKKGKIVGRVPLADECLQRWGRGLSESLRWLAVAWECDLRSRESQSRRPYNGWWSASLRDSCMRSFLVGPTLLLVPRLRLLS